MVVFTPAVAPVIGKVVVELKMWIVIVLVWNKREVSGYGDWFIYIE